MEPLKLDQLKKIEEKSEEKPAKPVMQIDEIDEKPFLEKLDSTKYQPKILDQYNFPFPSPKTFMESSSREK